MSDRQHSFTGCLAYTPTKSSYHQFTNFPHQSREELKPLWCLVFPPTSWHPKSPSFDGHPASSLSLDTLIGQLSLSQTDSYLRNFSAGCFWFLVSLPFHKHQPPVWSVLPPKKGLSSALVLKCVLTQLFLFSHLVFPLLLWKIDYHLTLRRY